MGSPGLHRNFLAQSAVILIGFLVEAELDHRIVEPETNPRVEGMDNDLRIVRPCLKRMSPVLCKKSKSLDATILAVVACQYQ